MLNYLHQLPDLLAREPHRAHALVASGVFGWDTQLSPVTPRPEFAQTLFHTVVGSLACDPAVVGEVRDWFLAQPDGAQRWDALLWEPPRTTPVRLAFEHERWTMAQALTDAMHATRPGVLTPEPRLRLAVHNWLESWHHQYGKDFSRWCQAATWLSDSGWVRGVDAWATSFNPGTQDGGHHPLEIAALCHGEAGVQHLLDLGARPRGFLRHPVTDAEGAPVLYDLLDRWFVRPSLALSSRHDELARVFTRLVSSDWEAIRAMQVPFSSPRSWPTMRQLDGSLGDLSGSEQLGLAERQDLERRAAMPISRKNRNGPTGTTDHASLPMPLLLRALGPREVQVMFEQEALRGSFDTSPTTAARSRARL